MDARHYETVVKSMQDNAKSPPRAYLMWRTIESARSLIRATDQFDEARALLALAEACGDLVRYELCGGVPEYLTHFDKGSA